MQKFSKLLPLLLAGCGLNSTQALPPTLITPSTGATVWEPWVPIMARAPLEFAHGTVTVQLDGTDMSDPWGALRVRKEKAEYLSILKTDGLLDDIHNLQVTFITPDGERAHSVSQFQYQRPPNRVTLKITDGNTPIAARVHVERNGAPLRLYGPNPMQSDPNNRDAQLSSLFVDGSLDVWLPDGEYTFTAIRGVRYEIDSEVLTLDKENVVSLTLPKVIETPGSIAADLHIHTLNSKDAFIPNEPRWWSLGAADLDIVVITDHNIVTDPRDKELPLPVIPGLEQRFGPNSKPQGHYNVFPLATEDVAPLPAANSTSPARHWAALKRRQINAPFDGKYADLLIQVNHPRGMQFNIEEPPDRQVPNALFNQLGMSVGESTWLSEEVGGVRGSDFDVLEIINRFSWALYLDVRRDWFSLLNAGYDITGSGNSDSHALAVELAGFPVNFVHSSTDTSEFVAAVKDGQLVVSTGPVIDMVVQSKMGSARPGQTIAAGDVLIDIQVRAASWVPLPEVRVVVNGQVVKKYETLSLRSFSTTLPLHMEPGSWVLVEAGWPLEDDGEKTPQVGGDYQKLLPGYVPMGFTNPVRAVEK